MTSKRILWPIIALACALAAAASVFMLNKHTSSASHKIAHGSPEEKLWAIRELAKRSPGPAAWQKISAAVGDSDTMVRVAAVGALKASADRSFTPLISKVAAEDGETIVRASAIDSLAALGGDEAWKTVLSFLNSEEADLRAVAVECAGRYGRPEAVASLRAMTRTDSSQEVRARTEAVIKAIDPEEAPTPATQVETRAFAAPDGTIYFEAENCVQLKPNFELAPSLREMAKRTRGADKDPLFSGIENHSGRGWLRALQGAGGRANYWGGDFLCPDIGKASYPIIVPADGSYRLWLRVWWMDDCGNSLYTWFDNNPKATVSAGEAEGGETNFRKWYWFNCPGNNYLAAGAHTLHLEVCEDGIRVDAIALLPAGRQPPEGPVRANMNPLALAPPGAEVHLSCEAPTIDSKGNLYVTVFLLRTGSQPLDGKVTLDTGNGVPDCGKAITVRLDNDDYIFSKDVLITYPQSEPYRESYVHAGFASKDGGLEATASMIAEKSWPWEYSGPYKERKAPDRILSDQEMTWRSIPPEEIFGRYGIMDFEKVLGNEAHGYMYLRTRVRMPEDTSIRWLLQADDTAQVWMDGKHLLNEPHSLPLEACLNQILRQETNGEHVIVAESYQTAKHDKQLFDTQNYWSMRLRARADYHSPANIEGLQY